MNKSTFVNTDPPLPAVTLAPAFKTTKVILHCACGMELTARTTEAIAEAYADHRAYVHGVPR